MARAVDRRWPSLIGFWLCFGCARATPESSRPLELTVPTEAMTLDPRYSTRALDIKVTRLVHAGLIGLDPQTLEPRPLVASSYRFLDDRALVVELRPEVRFHSGKPLEPADVCATLAALRDPAMKSPHRAVVRAIARCLVEQPNAVRLELGEARATLLTDLEVPILRADQARSRPNTRGDLDGLGPYRVESFSPAEIRLEPAETHLRPLPVHPVVVRTVRDENARAIRLLAGRSDVVPNALSPTLLPALAEQGLGVRARPGANVTYLLFQNERPPFDRVEVRHAIARAIDRAGIVRTLLAGRGTPASFLLPPGHWATPVGLAPEPFDPAAARAVLGGVGPVTLYTSTDRARVTIARAIAQMLEDVGLAARVVSLDLGVLLERLDAGDFLMATLQMPELTEPNLLKWFFHPAAVPGEGGEGRNRARYRSAEAGRLLDEASQVRDFARRRELYAKLAERMLQDLPVVPLWHEDQVAVVSERAQSFALSAEGRWASIAGVP